jgi:PAS domain S-box-containing protein
MKDFGDLISGVSQEDYKSLFQLAFGANSSLAIILQDPEGRVTFWNRGAECITGFRAEEMLGEFFGALFLPEDRTLKVPERELLEAAAKGYTENERWLHHKSDTRFWGSGINTCIRDESGRSLGYVKVFRDRTISKQTEEKINRINAELTHFIHLASHDLQEPLRMIGLYLELLKKRCGEKLDREANEFVEHAGNSARRLQTLIDDLLKYSQAGNEEESFAPADMSSIFDAVVDDLKPAVDGKKAIVTRQTMPILHVNAPQISEVFLNLLSNALKYSRAGVPPVILVDARPINSEWVFCVQDNGIGIPENQQQAIFGPFKRLHAKDRYAGTGLGLAICKKIIERHKGRIWLESSPGHGARFYFSLPRRQNE